MFASKTNNIHLDSIQFESLLPKVLGVYLSKLNGKHVISLSLILTITLLQVGSAPHFGTDMEQLDQDLDEAVLAQYIDEMNYVPDNLFDYWGYQRLAAQIGEEKAREVAGYIEYSSYPELIKAIITVESAWRVEAESNAQALGLMQIRMITAHEYEPDLTMAELFNPAKNIQIGIQIFEDHMNYFDDFTAGEHWALTSYNRGRFGTFSLDKNIPSTRYSRKVLALSEDM